VTDSTYLQFPALDMMQDGYGVHGAIDASGAEAPGQIVREACIATLAQAGVKLRTWFGIAAELVADWRRDQADGWRLARRRSARSPAVPGATCWTPRWPTKASRWGPHE
jgi:hypothetical protein